MTTYTSWILFTAVSLITGTSSSSSESGSFTMATTTTTDRTSLQSPLGSTYEPSLTPKITMEEEVESPDVPLAAAADDLAQYLVKLDRTSSWIKSNQVSTLNSTTINSDDVWDSNSFTELYAATFGSQAPFRDDKDASSTNDDDAEQATKSGEQLSDSERFDRMVQMYPLWKPSGSCSSGSSDWDAESDLDELEAVCTPLTRTTSIISTSTRSTTSTHSQSSSYISYFFGKSRSTSSLDGSLATSLSSLDATSDTSSEVFNEKEILSSSWAEKIGGVEMCIIAGF